MKQIETYIQIHYDSKRSDYPFIKINEGETTLILNPMDHFNYITKLDDLAFLALGFGWEGFLKQYPKSYNGLIYLHDKLDTICN